MKGKIRNFFSSSNTSQGFCSFYEYIIDTEASFEKIYIKDPSNNRKTSIMKNIGEFFNNQGYDIEYYCSCSNNNFFDAVVINKLNIALLNSASPHIMDSLIPEPMDEILNIEQYLDKEKLKKHKSKIVDTNKKIYTTFKRANNYITAAKLIHDNWSSCNKEALNYSKIILLQEDLKEKILSNCIPSDIGKERHLFATSLCCDGIVTLIDNICEDCENIYSLNGGPGTGKNQVLEYICKESLRRGLLVEIYHSPLIPNEIEHIIIPELKTALLSSNELNNKRFTGIQIFTENFLDYSLIDRDVLLEHKDTFYKLLNKGLSIMDSLKKLYDNLEIYYRNNMNFKDIDELYDGLINKLEKYTSDK
jgi:hypothetical protein